MPIETDQKDLKKKFIINNIVSMIYTAVPFVILLYVIDFIVTGDRKDFADIFFMLTAFVLFAGRIFRNHKIINYMFDTHYKMEDRMKIRKLWYYNTNIPDKLYGKLHLPILEKRKISK